MSEETRNLQELIDEYLKGRLEGENLRNFEERLKSDNQLKEKLDAEQEFTDHINFYHERVKLKMSLDEIHSEMENENILELPSEKSQGKSFFNRHLTTISVAASVAIFSILGTILTLDYLKSIENNQYANYRQLRRDVEQIRKSQQQIIDDLTTENSPGKSKYSGTGVALTSDGYIITSYHVVRGNDSVYVENEKTGRLTATVAAYDEQIDLAILKVKDSTSVWEKLPYSFQFIGSDLGEEVFTLGYPKDEIVYNEGSISSSNGYYGDSSAYQISIPVHPGNSGGPLLDDKGNIIGVISGKQGESEGIAFAIKSENLMKMIDKINEDSTTKPIHFPTKNLLRGLTRPQQIKKLKDFVFIIKVDK
jgi:serine protease Do